MSTAAGSSGSGGQKPSGGRATGAGGGPNGKFPCRNHQQPGHPSNYWVDLYDQLCPHCLITAQVMARDNELKFFLFWAGKIESLQHLTIEKPGHFVAFTLGAVARNHLVHAF
ncbi:hypothetical protein BDU57DRAFT_529834 [Ampelomyces quisqualis]|uniref:Uncharacterized protein n=1 Tax=Ampelomyces quisqualis TaxID=50730 RepID=A0A6A5QNA5_AMPQU|nr:hypothetical protein BDU57DRAFT_529834 [Ampelomyces quisqualis]